MPTRPLRIEVIDEEMARVLRAKTGAERLQIANEMFLSAQRMISSQLRADHPDWDERRIREETARRISQGPSDEVLRRVEGGQRAR